MSLDQNLLLKALKAADKLNKEAFTPMTPEAQAAAAGPMPGGGGAPPMDPAMMGGMPPGGGMPMDPAMMMGGGMPMDPAMMGGMPPMDPAMMGGMPPMDPAMMGGAPPMDPMAAGGDPAAGGEAPQTVQLNMEDLKQILQEAVDSEGAASGERKEEDAAGSVEERLTRIETMLEDILAGSPAQVAQTEGAPEEEGMPGAEPELPPEEGGGPPIVPEEMVPPAPGGAGGGLMPGGEPNPADLAAMLQNIPMGGSSGMMPPAPGGMQVQASKGGKKTMLTILKDLKRNQ